MNGGKITALGLAFAACVLAVATARADPPTSGPHCLHLTLPGGRLTCDSPPCRLCGPQRWNFEPHGPIGVTTRGDLQGWNDNPATDSPLSPAPSRGPAAGSAVTLMRVLSNLPPGPPPAGHGQLDRMRSLLAIGGNYWDGPYHTGYEGTFWLGSNDNRPTLGSLIGGTPTDGHATMDMVSPEFSITTGGPRYLQFLAGGCGSGAEVRLERKVYRAVYPTGACDTLQAAFDTADRALNQCLLGGVPERCAPYLLQHAHAREALTNCRATAPAGLPRNVTCPAAATCPAWETVETWRTLPDPPAVPGAGAPLRARYMASSFVHARGPRGTAACNEIMSRVTWLLDPLVQPLVRGYVPEDALNPGSAAVSAPLALRGSTPVVYRRGDPIGYAPEDASYRIRVIDTSATGYISVDDLSLTNAAAAPAPAARRPLWGVADLHAHLMNELGTMAFDGGGPGIASRALWGSTFGGLPSVTQCNNTHTTNDNLDLTPHQFNSHEDEALGTTYTLCRDVCLDEIEGTSPLGGNHKTHGGFNGNWHDWPAATGAIHQQMHWSWVKRAWQGGLRVMIAAVGNSETIGFSLVGEGNHAYFSDQDALALQIPALKTWAASSDVRDWAEIAYTPEDARRIVGAGRLAIILGVELDQVVDSCDADVTRQNHHTASSWGPAFAWASAKGFDVNLFDTSSELGFLGAALSTWASIGATTRVMHYAGHPDQCSPAAIQARVDALYGAGIRHVIPMHFSDNTLGGYAITQDLFLANSVFENRLADPPRFMTVAQASALGIDLGRIPFDVGGNMMVPGWMRADLLSIGSVLGAAGGLSVDPAPLLAEGILNLFRELGASTGVPAIQSFVEALTGACIEDDGWRAFFGVITLGATELSCLITDEIREAIPWEGAVDTPLVFGLGIPGPQRKCPSIGAPNCLPGQINTVGLRDNGREFLTQMMRRGMIIDVQHGSERSKMDIVALTRSRPLRGLARDYPLTASHGGVSFDPAATRDNENVLSRSHFDEIYGARGLVGLGTRSIKRFREQLAGLRQAVCATGTVPSQPLCRVFEQRFGAALGTDINGFDWHALPTVARGAAADFGGPVKVVRYTSYDLATNPGASADGCTDCVRLDSNPPLSPHQVTGADGRTRTYDINFDGLAHYGMLPDFLQAARNLQTGTALEDMAPLLRSAEATVEMWEEACRQAYASLRPEGVPSDIRLGCGNSAELVGP